MLKVVPVWCRKGKMDNISYILQDEKTKVTAVVDPSEAKPVMMKCEELGIKPDYIINTHHHFDHTDGNLEVKQKYKCKIICNKNDAYRIKGADIMLGDKDEFAIGESKFKVIEVNGHTIGHILIYFAKDKKLFTGDTLFNLSIGGLFEGTQEQMFESLKKIKNLPDDVEFFAGHEYTPFGAQNAYIINNGNEDIVKYLDYAKKRLEQGLEVCPIKLGLEKKCNPYLQANSLSEFAKL